MKMAKKSMLLLKAISEYQPREIVFRGLLKNGARWVYGDLFHDWSKMNTKPDIYIVNRDGKFEVIPETVCESIDIRDSNGKLNFENDIFELTSYTGKKE